MGLFSRKRPDQPTAQPTAQPRWPQDRVRRFGGGASLQVVGESFHQEALRSLARSRSNIRVQVRTTAVLKPDPHNEYDSNAVGVWTSAGLVGHLGRDDAAAMQPVLLAWLRSEAFYVELEATIGGQEMLGIFLYYDPTDFGLPPAPPPPPPPDTRPRTGMTDVGRDMSWLEAMPFGAAAIPKLQALLSAERDPLIRHYQWAELEKRLYKERNTFASALDEFDAACGAHDAELDATRPLLVAALGSVPLLETHKQACIRWDKAKDYAQVIRWATLGLALYGDIPSRPEFAADLRGRLDKAMTRPR